MAGPIAVICAMDWEMAHLRRDLPQDHLDAGPVVLKVSGFGMQPAADATREVIEEYAPRAVLNYGCAGAHRAELLLGDIVVGTRAVAYEQDQVVAADVALLDAARRVAAGHAEEHEAWPAELGWPPGVAHRRPRIEFGTVASADRWNRSAEDIAGLVARCDSLCEDMEAAAIGVVCASSGVPFLSVKDISNNELLRETLDAEALLAGLRDQAARRAARFTLALVREVHAQR